MGYRQNLCLLQQKKLRGFFYDFQPLSKTVSLQHKVFRSWEQSCFEGGKDFLAGDEVLTRGYESCSFFTCMVLISVLALQELMSSLTSCWENNSFYIHVWTISIRPGKKSLCRCKGSHKIYTFNKVFRGKKNDTGFPSQLKMGSCWKKKNCSCWTNAEADGPNASMYHTFLNGF